MISHDHIAKLAAEAGFAHVGVARARALDEHAAPLENWLAAGRNGDLGYMERHRAMRLDPRRMVEGARSVIVCALAYSSPEARKNSREAWERDGIPRRAAFTTLGDYHGVIKERLHSMLAGLRQAHPALRGRALVDSAPILEKAWAAEAGIGRAGRNSLIINPLRGSFILLGELVIDMECDRYDVPIAGDPCGSCRRCIEACPVGALGEDRRLDARRCISALSVEGPRMTGAEASQIFPEGWILGCDACLEICPYNQ